MVEKLFLYLWVLPMYLLINFANQLKFEGKKFERKTIIKWKNREKKKEKNCEKKNEKKM